MAGNKGVNGRPWQRLRAALIAQAQANDQPCPCCGERIRYDLPGTHPDGPSVDHIVARTEGGTGDPVNLQVMRMRCNSAKEGRRRKRPQGNPSRDW